VVDFLLEHEAMSGEQFEAIMEGREVGETSATAMFDIFEEKKEELPAAEEKTEE